MSEGPMATATKSGAPDPLLGRVIAERFRITSLIARGGMGKVYRAEQSPLGRLCAIKVLNPNYNGDADPEFHRRFFREASITSKITHPNSVTIFDYGKTDDDIYYMAMEYLEGQTLHQALREVGTMPEDRVARIAAQICRALREAHALGVIHRDLKPANIFLSRHGDDEDFVKVLDFGLVKHITERPEEQLTQTGLFMGSPKYMAPEQIQGGVVDFRTDIYSLGIIMYEMLAGKVPFERATSVNILMAHVGEPPPPMREVNPNLICSPSFEELVMRCIAKDPEERWSSMDQVLQAIKLAHGAAMTGQLAAVTGGFVPTYPPPAVASSQQRSVHPPSVSSGSHTPAPLLRADASDETYPQPRSRAWLGLGVVVAAVLGGLLGMAAFRMTTSTAPRPPASASQPLAAPSASVGAQPLASATPAPSTSAAPASPMGVRFTSEPPGATVFEDGAALCAPTPCEVVFKGDGTGRSHHVTFEKKGYRPEPKTFRPGEGDVSARLAHGHAAPGVRPHPSAKPEASSATPSGFKEFPAY
jgi:eukaryotic-like serine/threonine-protein kinase